MRNAEWISLIAFSFFIIVSWLQPLSWRRRIAIAVFGVTGIVLIVGIQFADRFLPTLTASVTRDFLPAILMPMVYWQAGRFTTQINKPFQDWLQRFDRKLFSSWLPGLELKKGYRWIAAFLELAYLSCYVLVPMGLAVLYLKGLQRHAEEYWFVVLAATLPCYAFTAFVPTHPPRSLELNSSNKVAGNVRRFNLWIVQWFTIQLNTFPSGHVTATLGSSLVVMHFAPAIGAVLVLISVGIALGAVLGRYHYAPDVIMGAAVTILVYALIL